MNKVFFLICLVGILIACGQTTLGQTTEFTYQGRLLNGGVPANGSHDFEFRLFDDATGDTQIGPSIPMSAVNVNNGVFSVRLDFGNQFPGANRFLDIRVRATGDQFFAILTPRQAITSAPYAIKSLNSETATILNGLPANQYVLTGDARLSLSDARNPLPNSANYIQNSTSPQAASDFNVSGSGTVGGTLSGNLVITDTQFYIRGKRVLDSDLGNNTLLGVDAGLFIVPEVPGGLVLNNSIFGASAGKQTTEGGRNSFFGFGAGFLNTIGRRNSFIGGLAGFNNTEGSFNTVIGDAADVAAGDLDFATAIGASSRVSQTNSLVLGAINNVNGATADTNVGIGTSAPSQRLHIRVNNGNILFGGAGCSSGFTGIGFGATLSGCANYSLLGNGADTIINRPSGGSIFFRAGNSNQVTINPNGAVTIKTLDFAGATSLCRNASNQISTCSSSIRYKTNIHSFSAGLSLIKQLRPVSYKWKDGDLPDLGLIAEEVNRVEPLLSTTNNKGEVEGVEYDRLGVVLVNALKEQQSQIESQQKAIAAQQAKNQQQEQEIKALKKFVCRSNPQAKTCKQK